MGEWMTVRLGDVCKFVKTKHTGEILPYIGMEHIESGTGCLVSEPTTIPVKSSTFRFNQMHVLYGRLRPYLNKVLLPEFEGHCSTEIFPIECNPCLDRRFLFYWLTSETTVSRINRTSTGARMPRANVNAVLDFEFPLPPLPEQERIVAILDEALAAIVTATVNAEKNLANARELFESELNAVFSQKGDGWIEKKLGDVCEIGDGNYSSKYPKAHEFLPEGVPFLTATNLKGGTIHPGKMRFISKVQHSFLTKGHIREGDLVIVVRGSSTGNSSIVPKEYDGANLNSQLAFLRPSNEVNKNYLFNAFNSPMLQYQVKIAISGAAQPQLPNKILLQLTISYPRLSEQKIIVSRLGRLSRKVQCLESRYQQKLTFLSELKQSILQKAFTGELTGKPDKVVSEAGL